MGRVPLNNFFFAWCSSEKWKSEKVKRSEEALSIRFWFRIYSALLYSALFLGLKKKESYSSFCFFSPPPPSLIVVQKSPVTILDSPKYR